jgi:choline dehydrogenase-like flavoprotein
MPRVEVHWQIDPLTRRTADRTLSVIASELETAGVAEVDTGPLLEQHGWPASFEREGTWHHMGTTRMHDDERKGVVNRDCRVHGLANLYVAGSSVFPTAGANFPTITLTALALRLADHVALQLNSTFSTPVDESVVVTSFIDEDDKAVAASVSAGGLSAT